MLEVPTVFFSEPAEYVVERSRFIGQTFRLTTPDEFTRHLDAMMASYPGANHYTWAYRINDARLRASDHGEPQGTAGLPMLNILTREGFDETLVIVVRYFGGIKLGRGGLVHAYQHAAKLALSRTVLGIVKDIQTIEAHVDYASFNRIQRPLTPLVMSWDAEYGADVKITAILEQQAWPAVQSVLEAESRGQWVLESSHRSTELVALPNPISDE